MSLELPPLALYIHFPWCVRKCPYCDFNSHPIKGSIPAGEYVEALISDLSTHLADIQSRPIQSIFMGGGTPSAFPVEDLEAFFKHLEQTVQFAPNIEITLEANPATVERGSFTAYRALGINRVSLGVQSFQNDKLKSLGRIHDDQQVYQAIEELKQSGIDNFNIDLMHGLPQQTLDDALFDLKAAISLAPTHLSWYQLTLEPNTRFYAFPPTLPHEDMLADIEEAGKALLTHSGFQQYEVSAYAQSEALQAKHNVNYWQFGDYIGIGAGAHGKITYPDQGQIIRHHKYRHPKQYLNHQNKLQGTEVIQEGRSYEFMLNALRLNQGFSVETFEQRTGLSMDSIRTQLTQASERGLLNIDSNHIKPTPLGFRFLNDLLERFS